MKKIILVYHQINEDDLFMSASLEQFIMQMEYLKSKKFKFCNLKELLHEQSGNNVCVMFDDCYSSIKPAVNYMKERQLKYCLAVIPNKLGKKGFLKKEELSGTLYFHTNNHYNLTLLNDDDLTFELNTDYNYYSKCVVYPMGKYNDKIIEKVSENFKYGLSLLPFHVGKKSNMLELPRICVNGYLKFFKFKLFVSKLGNIYLHGAFIKRKILGQDYLSE